MQKFKILYIICLLSSLGLSGCARTPQDIPKLSLEARQQYLSQMQHWQAQGRFAIRERNTGNNVSFHWRQDNQKYHLYFFSPLVSDSAHLTGEPGQVTLVTSDGKKYRSASPEKLVQEHLGWSLPFAKMAYWIKGMPAPGAVQLKEYDQYNQLQTLKQDGWLVEYQSCDVYQPFTLPAKITLHKGNVSLKVVISSWKK